MAKQSESSAGIGLPIGTASIESAITQACSTRLGVLDSSFLCRSVSVLNPKDAVCVREDCSVDDVVSLLRLQKVGCLVVTDARGVVVGIFSERDLLLKVMEDFPLRRKDPVSKHMTLNPVTQPPHATIAFVLNLMSLGGFRHLPIVDEENKPIGMISVKDVVDFIVQSVNEDILGLELESGPEK